MGTYFGWNSKQQLVDELNSDINESFELLRSSCVGNNLWQLIRHKESDNVFVGLAKITCSKGDWGYKPMDETAGPYYFDCPISYINKSSDTDNKTVLEWREKVREHHKRKKNAHAWKAGQAFELWGFKYKLVNKIEGKRSWVAQRLNDSVRCRVPSSYLKSASFIE